MKFARSKIQSFLSKYEKRQQTSCCDEPDTWIYPLLQMGPFDIHNDYEIFKELLVSCDPDDEIHLATAYFNPLDEYIKLITERSRCRYKILAASPQVCV